MIGYLHRVAERAVAEDASSLRPRLPSVFEPNTYAIEPRARSADELAFNQPSESDGLFAIRADPPSKSAEMDRDNIVRQRSESPLAVRQEYVETRPVSIDPPTDRSPWIRDAKDVSVYPTKPHRFTATANIPDTSPPKVVNTELETRRESHAPTRPHSAKTRLTGDLETKIQTHKENVRRTKRDAQSIERPDALKMSAITVGQPTEPVATRPFNSASYLAREQEAGNAAESMRRFRTLPETSAVFNRSHSSRSATGADTDRANVSQRDLGEQRSQASVARFDPPQAQEEADTGIVPARRVGEPTLEYTFPMSSRNAPRPPLSLGPITQYARSLSTPSSDGMPPQTVVQVTIGRVEIKAVPPPRNPVKAAAGAPSVMSLDEYIGRQAVGGGG